MSYYENMPRSLRIGAHDYSIELMPTEWKRDDGDVVFGEFHEFEQKIMLRSDIKSASMAMEVAVHEIMHVIIHPLNFEAQQEEQLTQVIGLGLAQVIRDNPALLEWMMEKTEANDNQCKCGNCQCNKAMDSDLFRQSVSSPSTKNR